MFIDSTLIKPKTQSIVLTIVIAIAVFWGADFSPIVSYFLGVGCLVLMIVASLIQPFWPTRRKTENTIVFSLFWGIILGAIVPSLLNILLKEGFAGIYELLVS